jgi:hypothetical protein
MVLSAATLKFLEKGINVNFSAQGCPIMAQLPFYVT